MKKVLIVATVARFISSFELNNIKILQELGYEVHCACNYNEEGYKKDIKLDEIDIVQHQIDFARSPFSKENIKAYNQLKKLMKDIQFNLVDCHTPVGGVLARLVAKKYRKNGLKVMYTAHGFHFFKGAPFLNWIIYYPIEKWLAHYTDCLITINKEDYNRAKKFKSKDIKKIPGVGIDINKINSVDIDILKKREELRINKDKFVIVSVGELNKNKNHEVIIKAIAQIKNKDIVYLICGKGNQFEYLKNLSEQLGVYNQVKLLGQRQDVFEILKVADCFAFPSIREGLGIAALEAIAVGLPLITSRASGVKEYSQNGKTGFSCSALDYISFSKNLQILINNENLRNKIRKYNLEVAKIYDIKNVNKIMKGIYK